MMNGKQPFSRGSRAAILILILFSDMEKEAIQPAAKQSSSSTAASCLGNFRFQRCQLVDQHQMKRLTWAAEWAFREDFTEKWKEMEINQVLLCGVFLNKIVFFFQK